jgi:hypothetical protein
MPDEVSGGERQREVLELVQLLNQFPSASSNLWLKQFPIGSCSITSYAIGTVLHRRHDEDWILLSHSASKDQATGDQVPYTHTWLCLDPSGRGPTVDATAHQFPQLALTGPYVGNSATPYLARFAAPNDHIQAVSVAHVEPWWHHGYTAEVYDWFFAELGLDTTRDL